MNILVYSSHNIIFITSDVSNVAESAGVACIVQTLELRENPESRPALEQCHEASKVVRITKFVQTRLVILRARSGFLSGLPDEATQQLKNIQIIIKNVAGLLPEVALIQDDLALEAYGRATSVIMLAFLIVQPRFEVTWNLTSLIFDLIGRWVCLLFLLRCLT